MSAKVFYDFSGVDVVVTGVTSGIGAATAKAFIDAGARVVGTGTRRTVAASTLPAGLEHYASLQLEDPESISEFAASIGKIDVLVNNAGHVMPEARFADVIQVNLNAVYSLSNALIDRLAESQLSGGASVVNIASMMSFFGSPHLLGYGAAKAGVVQLTQSLAAGWASRRVRVNAVAPGSVPTAMTQQYAGDPHWSKVVSDKTPLARWADPAEIASAILFLSSSGASFVTGHTLVVDGGYSIID